MGDSLHVGGAGRGCLQLARHGGCLQALGLGPGVQGGSRRGRQTGVTFPSLLAKVMAFKEKSQGLLEFYHVALQSLFLKLC